MSHYKATNIMKEHFLDLLRTAGTGVIAFIGIADLEALLKIAISLAILIYWLIKIYKQAKKKKEIKEEE
jgi:hypothetical protein